MVKISRCTGCENAADLIEIVDRSRPSFENGYRASNAVRLDVVAGRVSLVGAVWLPGTCSFHLVCPSLPVLPSSFVRVCVSGG